MSNFPYSMNPVTYFVILLSGFKFPLNQNTVFKFIGDLHPSALGEVQHDIIHYVVGSIKIQISSLCCTFQCLANVLSYLCHF